MNIDRLKILKANQEPFVENKKKIYTKNSRRTLYRKAAAEGRKLTNEEKKEISYAVNKGMWV